MIEMILGWLLAFQGVNDPNETCLRLVESGCEQVAMCDGGNLDTCLAAMDNMNYQLTCSKVEYVSIEAVDCIQQRKNVCGYPAVCDEVVLK